MRGQVKRYRPVGRVECDDPMPKRMGAQPKPWMVGRQRCSSGFPNSLQRSPIVQRGHGLSLAKLRHNPKGRRKRHVPRLNGIALCIDTDSGI